MPVYQYRGYRNDGGSAAGIIDAENAKIARLKLRKDGVFPTDVVEQPGAAVRSQENTGSTAVYRPGRFPSLSANDLALMTRQFATLLVAGLPLVDALGVLVDQAEKKPVKALFADIPSAIANTVEIARRCSLSLVLCKPQLPTWSEPARPAGHWIRYFFASPSFWRSNWHSRTK